VVSALFRAASSTAFDKLYRRHAAAVYRYARAVLGNHADAEDVAQQTFLNAYRALAQGTKPRKAENWLFTIAHNEVRRHLRDTRTTRFNVELDEQVVGSETEPTEPSVADVLRALQQLTPNQRSALVMREFEGRSYAEIAELMGVSQSALETLIFRARRALAEALEDGLTCAEAELAVSRRLDGRLSRRDSRRLKAHMRECPLCARFEQRQRRRRSLVKDLSVIPVPASLLVFRGESAAAAGSLAVGAAATGGSAGIAAKAAAVVAAVTVAGTVGYAGGADPAPVGTAEPRIAQQQPAARPAASRPDAARVARPVTGARTYRVVPAGGQKRSRKPKPEQARGGKPPKLTAKPARAKEVRKARKAVGRSATAEKPARTPKAKRVHPRPAPKLPKLKKPSKPIPARSQPQRPRPEPQRLRPKPQRLRPEPQRPRPEPQRLGPKPAKPARPEKTVQPARVALTPPPPPPGREKHLVDPKPKKAP
jgi:RNA polymerase sigma factor (sigma-70 family)